MTVHISPGASTTYPLSVRANPAYQLVMLFFSVYAIVAFGAVVMLPPTAPEVAVIDVLDPAICALFFADFVFSMLAAPAKWQYFRTWGWLDLLSSVPLFDTLRVARLARILRALRVLRALRATAGIFRFIASHRRQSVAASLALVGFVLVAGCSMAVLQFEKGQGGNIQTAGDAIWWAIATVTTAGYGDVYPVTVEGRAVATLLMVAGIGIFGTFTGLIASWLLGSEKKLDATVEELRQSVSRLEALLDERRERGIPAPAPDEAYLRHSDPPVGHNNQRRHPDVAIRPIE